MLKKSSDVKMPPMEGQENPKTMKCLFIVCLVLSWATTQGAKKERCPPFMT